MLQLLLLCVLGMIQAVPIPISNILGYNMPYLYNFNQQNPLAPASFVNNPNNFGFSFPSALTTSAFQQINPFAAQIPQLNPSAFQPVRRNLFQSPFAAFPQLSHLATPYQPTVHNSMSGYHGHSNPHHYASAPTVNSYQPKIEVQRINLPPIVRENKLEIRQPVLNTVRYVQPTLYKVNRDRIDFDDDKYDFDDDDYKMAYSLHSQPTVLTYSIRSPSRAYSADHAPVSYVTRSHPTLFKRSQPAHYNDHHELEEEEDSGEAKLKSAGSQEEASEEAAEEEK